MRTVDLIIEIMGKDTPFIREEVAEFNQYVGTHKVGAGAADKLRGVGREYRALVKKHGKEL